MVRFLVAAALLAASMPALAQGPSAPTPAPASGPATAVPASGPALAPPASGPAPVAPMEAGVATAAGEEAPRTLGIVAELAVGGLLPMSRYDAGFYGSVKVGYQLPWLQRRLGVAIGAGYARTGRTVSGVDPRLPENNGAWTTSVSTDELVLDLEVFYRFSDGRRLVPYAGIGPALFLLRDRPTTFGLENTEDSTQVGFALRGGVDYRVGLGAAFGELRVQYANLDRTVPGDHNLGGVSLAVGYRFFF